ncbi:hypothetical protein TNCT_428812 [Trichonephila clavata]|uniref:Uncharacterized protein n=1 Tax=Trichonephila clavata TaxID=2740835 RepID=A0A8X6GGB0_TRICU|nr:hypothetical protein TNCT_428812 [Trichonephila clavata]
MRKRVMEDNHHVGCYSKQLNWKSLRTIPFRSKNVSNNVVREDYVGQVYSVYTLVRVRVLGTNITPDTSGSPSSKTLFLRTAGAAYPFPVSPFKALECLKQCSTNLFRWVQLVSSWQNYLQKLPDGTSRARFTYL